MSASFDPVTPYVRTAETVQDVEEIMGERVAVVLVHWKECGHCKTYRPVFERVAAKMHEWVSFWEMESEFVKKTGFPYAPKYYPLTMVLWHGKMVAMQYGEIISKPPDEETRALSKFVAPARMSDRTLQFLADNHPEKGLTREDD